MAESRKGKKRTGRKSESSDDQTGADPIAKYCCFLHNRCTETRGSGFIIKFEGLQDAKLLALDWEKRGKLQENQGEKEKLEKIGRLQTDYALITSHDTIPGLSPFDLQDWKVSCQGIKNGNEQALGNLVCGAISCCGPESLFGPGYVRAKIFCAHGECPVQLNITILFLSSKFSDKLPQGSNGCVVLPPVVSVHEYLDQDAHIQEYEHIISSRDEKSECTEGKCSTTPFRVYYHDEAKNVKNMTTELSLVQQQGTSQDTTSVTVDQKNAPNYEQLLTEIIEFERLQKLKSNCTMENCHGFPVVYVNQDTEPSVIGVHVGKSDQKGQNTVITLRGILKLLQGLVSVHYIKECAI